MALVYSSTSEDRYYLKFLRPDRTPEAGILAFLAKIDSPDNHAIRPVASRVCETGTLLLLPHAGFSLRDREYGQAHLVSFASQFLRGVSFLHKHKVAHCDLKTANVVVDHDTGHVTLIDFDLAVRGVDSLDDFAGTVGWTAPEVGNVTRYDPIRADVWAAGKVLHSVVSSSPKSADRQFLLDLAKCMMTKDPRKRPRMKNVVQNFDRYYENHAGLTCPSAPAVAQRCT